MAAFKEHNGQPPTKEVERVDSSTLDAESFMRDYVMSNKPVVLTNAVTAGGWAPMSWTPDALEACCGASSWVDVTPLQPKQGLRHAWLEPAVRWPRKRVRRSEKGGKQEGAAPTATDPPATEERKRDGDGEDAHAVTSPSPISAKTTDGHLDAAAAAVEENDEDEDEDEDDDETQGVLRPDLILAVGARRVSVPMTEFTAMLRGDVSQCLRANLKPADSEAEKRAALLTPTLSPFESSPSPTRFPRRTTSTRPMRTVGAI